MKKTVFLYNSKEPYVSFSRSYQFLSWRLVRVIKHQWVSESFFRVNDIVGFTRDLILLLYKIFRAREANEL